MDDETKEALEEVVRRIVAVAHPVKVVLFGSAARGTMGPTSDFDFLVVVSNGTHRRQTAGNIYRKLIGVGFPVDIVVVTEDDVREHGDNIGRVIMPALSEGKLVYAA
jgi:predicted nucleotidyltransferase